MGLLPLEFTDGLTDSPFFRETLQAHERELDLTNTAIKHLIKDIKDLIAAARNLSRAQRTLSDTLNNFNFECIGNSQTDDELIIANSFKDFARLLSTIEDERDRLLEKADEAFLEPIERFRRDQIGSAKEAKKKFEKETAKYCQNLERYLNLSVKKSETQLWEADANNSMEQQHFFKAMSEYVLKLQEVNERKKFEFVETVLSFMLGWLTFYHQGHEIATDFYSVKMELQMRLQRTRNNFNMTQEETKSLRKKMLDNQEKFRQKFQDSCQTKQIYTRQGYLFLMEKKAFTTSWTKHFCKYDKQTNRLKMIQYTQTTGKIVSTDEILVKECIKRNQDTIDRRFCFDIVAPIDGLSSNSNHQNNYSGQNNNNNNNCNNNQLSTQNSGNNDNMTNQKHSNSSSPNANNNMNNLSNDNNVVVYTFQAISEEDYKYWLETLNARDPYPTNFNNQKSQNKNSNKSNTNDNNNDNHSNDINQLDAEGYWFVKKCIQTIESHGLDQKGIYRMVGVASRVRTLMDLFAQSKSFNQNYDNNIEQDIDRQDLLPNFQIDSDEFETKTITSALKSYLRNLNEPIMTFKLHQSFITAAKLENRQLRIERIHQLVHSLPPINFKILKILIEHLQKVAKLHDTNLMTSSNLGVCFGPTLLRTAEESVAAIMDIKFVNVIAELLIENYEKFFLTKPSNMQQEQSIQHINYVNNQIQQRPLPNVPVGQHHYVKTIYETPSNMNRLIATSQQQQSSTNICRSNSQDQLQVINMQSKSRALYCPHQNNNNNNNQNGVSPMMLQVGPSKQYTFSYPQYQIQQSQLNNNNNTVNNNAQRLALHLSLSSSTPSPSLGSTTLTTITSSMQQPNMYSQQLHLQQQQQKQMINKHIPNTNSDSIYGQIRQPTTASTTNVNHLQQMQPSISYQNLHYNNDLSVALSGDNLLMQKKSPTGPNINLIYNRPMTSIGIMTNNSNYTNLLRSSSNENEIMNKNNYSPLTNESMQSSGFVSIQPPNNQQQTMIATASATSMHQQQQHPSRSMNFSSSSSTSLPSTPEHSQQSQFPYKLPSGMSLMKSTVQTAGPLTPTTTTTMMLNKNLINNNQIGSIMTASDPINELYGTTTANNSNNVVNHSLLINQQQQSINKSIYATISSANPTSPSQSIMGRTVRTRYVCIGGSDGELSFQPNMVITNVRPSREPGWLEGTLNGKTGLIPLNYVEYID